jgi:hypothetical protein
VPELGPKIKLTAAACGEYAALVLTDGKKSCHTPIVKVSNLTSGKAGLWLYQIGERQEFGHFQLSKANFAPGKSATTTPPQSVIRSDEFKAPNVPSPQDWVLVLQAVNHDNNGKADP